MSIRDVIRVLVVDDHQAIRAGLVALLRQEPGFLPVATAATAESALSVAGNEAVDVAVVDYHLPDGSGVDVCRRLPEEVGCVVYTAVPLDQVLTAALVAGARGIVAKGAPVEELFDAIRQVARGRAAHPPVTDGDVAAAGRHVAEDDVPVIEMAVAATSRTAMAESLHISELELERRIDRTLDALQRRRRPLSVHAADPRYEIWSSSA